LHDTYCWRWAGTLLSRKKMAMKRANIYSAEIGDTLFQSGMLATPDIAGPDGKGVDTEAKTAKA